MSTQKKRGARVGNTNAKLYDQESFTMRVNGGLARLIDDYALAVAGNGAPSNAERKEVVEEAIRRLCTRPVEDNQAMIF